MMAGCVLSEDQFLCAVCLDVFSKPVSLPCGHTFCKACITKYWRSDAACQCPMCKQTFPARPALNLNYSMSELSDQFRATAPFRAQESPAPRLFAGRETADMLCDVCPGTKLKALRSCLVCLASYCERHLEPHRSVAALRRHKLVAPAVDLADRVCAAHDKTLELFCRSDGAFVCTLCLRTDHRGHDVVPMEDRFEETRRELDELRTEVAERIATRARKIPGIQSSVDPRGEEAELGAIWESTRVLVSHLIHDAEQTGAELAGLVEESRKGAKEKARDLVEELREEIAKLRRRGAELEELSHTEDHLHLLRRFPALSALPRSKDWSRISVRSDLGALRRAMLRLRQTLDGQLDGALRGLCEAELRAAREHAVDLHLDPDTANGSLVLSADGKRVRIRSASQSYPDFPQRFRGPNVLAKEGFTSGKFYYEVKVTGKTDWIIGVARESVDKYALKVEPESGYWTLCLSGGCHYKALADPNVPLSLEGKPQKMGVFVDYEEGLVSFYDVEAMVHIYSFCGCSFPEKLHPSFCTQTHNDGKNSASIVITPVTHDC